MMELILWQRNKIIHQQFYIQFAPFTFEYEIFELVKEIRIPS